MSAFVASTSGRQKSCSPSRLKTPVERQVSGVPNVGSEHPFHLQHEVRQMSKVRTLLKKIRENGYVSKGDWKLIVQSLKMFKKRFVIFTEDGEYDGFDLPEEHLKDYRFETLERAVEILGAEFEHRRSQNSKIIVDMLTGKRVYHSNEWLAENPKQEKYKNKEEMLERGLINQNEYDLLKGVGFDQLAHMVNDLDARRSLCEYMRQHKTYLGNLDEMCQNRSLCVAARHALRNGKITLAQATQLARLPLSEQGHPLEILINGGRVILHGY